jgi:ABC-type antimicrobial peptide transport system permease subunit
MALGASAGLVQRQVLGGTLRLAGMGIVLGSIVSLMAARLIASLLFGTSPWDVTTYVAMVVGLMLVAAVSGYLPARRASRISPLVALRAE